MTIAKITDAYVRHYSDNGQTTAYVEWIDDRGVAGRTEGEAEWPRVVLRSPHMIALFTRANREGIAMRVECW